MMTICDLSFSPSVSPSLLSVSLPVYLSVYKKYIWIRFNSQVVTLPHSLLCSQSLHTRCYASLCVFGRHSITGIFDKYLCLSENISVETIVFFISLNIALYLVPSSSTVVVALTKCWCTASNLKRLMSSKHQPAFMSASARLLEVLFYVP